MEQVPPDTIVTVLPATVQTPGVVDAKPTGSPELAVAEIANGVAPNTTLLKGPKVMVCATVATMKLCVTGDAAE